MHLSPALPLSALLASLAIGCVPLESEFSPVAVVGVEPLAMVSAGGNHTCAALANGNTACWGSNAFRQLGVDILDADGVAVGSTSDPTYVPLARDPVEIAAGASATCVRFEGGGVSCFGANFFGELGFVAGCTGESPTEFSCPPAEPTAVPGLQDAVRLSVGGPAGVEKTEGGDLYATTFACALIDNGTVSCWGANRFGQASASSPSSVVTDPQTILDREGFPLRDIVDIATGDYHACALEAAGTVRCWGRDELGQRGPIGPDDRVAGVTDVKAIAAGSEHTCAVTFGGEVYCWGQNFAQQASTYGRLETCNDGLIDCVEVPQRIAGVGGAVDLELGDRHSCALHEDGGVTCWGGNQAGQLGVPERDLALPPQRAPIGKPAVALTAGKAHTCALHEDGTLSCWGRNSSGQVGVPRSHQ